MRRRWLIGLGLLALIALGLWLSIRTPVTPAVVTPSPADSTSPPAPVVKKSVPSVAQTPKPTPPAPATVVVTPVPPAPSPTKPIEILEPVFPAPPPVPLYPSLIPKNITIVRCYYESDVVGPNSRIGFDLNGSGFSASFQEMIDIELDGLDLRVENLKLVTPNQIHGDIIVGPSSVTGFVFPQVLIQGLPVFTAPEPFAVVRPGEVLSLRMTQVDNTGRSGRFRILTNLTAEQFKKLRVEPNTPGVIIKQLVPQLPFKIVGFMELAERVETGRYGVTVFLGNRVLYEKKQLVSIVNPNAGARGLVKGVSTSPKHARPGDSLAITISGSSFSPDDIRQLTVRLKKPSITATALSFQDAGHLGGMLQLPLDLDVGTYAVQVINHEGKIVFEDSRAISVVAENFVSSLRVDPPVRRGGTSTLKIKGRSFTNAFVSSLRISVDEEALEIGPIRLASQDQLEAALRVGESVKPGDYWIKLTVGDKPLSTETPTVIAVNP
jgi:hypothetical protein